MRAEPNNSAGLGGIGPEGIMTRLGMAVSWSPAAKLVLPLRKVLMPLAFSISKVRANEGFLKSMSTNRVRAPDWAKTTAVLIAVVDFPSPGNAEVTSITWGAWSECDRRIDILNPR